MTEPVDIHRQLERYRARRKELGELTVSKDLQDTIVEYQIDCNYVCFLLLELGQAEATIRRMRSQQDAADKVQPPVEKPETDEERKAKWRRDRHEHRIRDIDKALTEKGWANAYDSQPPYNQIVRVLMSDGEEGLAMYNTNYNRTCWLVKGFIGQYWRSMMGPFVTHWLELEKEKDDD